MGQFRILSVPYGQDIQQQVCTAIFTLFLLIILFAPHLAHAKGQLYCDPAIKSDLMSQATQGQQEHESRIDSFWQDPNLFENMYCGDQLDSSFNNVLSGVGLGNLLGQIDRQINDFLKKTCQQSLPLQNKTQNQQLAQACTSDALQQLLNGKKPKAQSISLTSALAFYLEIIAKHDPKYLNAIYNNPNYSQCLLIQMVKAWLARNPQYLLDVLGGGL